MVVGGESILINLKKKKKKKEIQGEKGKWRKGRNRVKISDRKRVVKIVYVCWKGEKRKKNRIRIMRKRVYKKEQESGQQIKRKSVYNKEKESEWNIERGMLTRERERERERESTITKKKGKRNIWSYILFRNIGGKRKRKKWKESILDIYDTQ